MPEITIYSLHDPDSGEMRYVGKTKNVKNRLEAHCSPGRRSRAPISQWIRGLRSAGKKPRLVILRVVDASGWEQAERDMIARCRAKGARLLNVAAGGLDMAHVHAPTGRCAYWRWVMAFCTKRGNEEFRRVLKVWREQINNPAIFEHMLAETLWEAAPMRNWARITGAAKA